MRVRGVFQHDPLGSCSGLCIGIQVSILAFIGLKIGNFSSNKETEYHNATRKEDFIKVFDVKDLRLALMKI
jgi:hypothetical protein